MLNRISQSIYFKEEPHMKGFKRAVVATALALVVGVGALGLQTVRANEVIGTTHDTAPVAETVEIDLSEIGTSDWVRFYGAEYEMMVRKDIPAPRITNIREIAGEEIASRGAGNDSRFILSWDEAEATTPTAEEINPRRFTHIRTTTYMEIGFAFDVPFVNANIQQLHVYAGTWEGTILLEFLIDDVVVYEYLFGVEGDARNVWNHAMIEFQLTNPASVASVQLTMYERHTDEWGGGSLFLSAIALAELEGTAPAESGPTASEGGELRFVIGSANYTLNGTTRTATAAAFLYEVDGGVRTMVPLRAVAEGLGGTANWVDGAAEITVDGQTVRVYPGAENALPDGMGYAINQEGTVFVPLRFVGETFGATPDWDGAAQAAYVRW
jgi:hypothetical protein